MNYELYKCYRLSFCSRMSTCPGDATFGVNIHTQDGRFLNSVARYSTEDFARKAAHAWIDKHIEENKMETEKQDFNSVRDLSTLKVGQKVWRVIADNSFILRCLTIDTIIQKESETVVKTKEGFNFTQSKDKLYIENNTFTNYQSARKYFESLMTDEEKGIEPFTISNRALEKGFTSALNKSLENLKAELDIAKYQANELLRLSK